MFINNKAEGTSASEPVIEMTEVVVAATDIPQDQQILQEQIIVKEMPTDQVHAEMIQDITMAINQYTTADIKQDEVLMNHRIQEKEEEKEVVSRKINEGYRAVSTEVTYVTGVSNLIHPEDYVDVVLTSDKNIETKIILEKVRVLAVGERMIEKQIADAIVLYQAVTLELDQDDTVKLINADAHGALQLVLYSKSDVNEETVDQKSTPESDQEITETDSNIITIPAESIIRKSASLSAPPIEIVKEETSLLLLHNQETDEDGRIWLEVETTDKENGWISSRIIKGEQE